MNFLNKLYTKAVFSEDSNMNVVASDMGENQITISLQENIVERLRTATGTVGSLNIFVPVDITIEILKTSPAYENYIKRCNENGYIGGSVTIYDDVNNEHTFSEVTITTQEFPSMNGSNPAHTFTIQANWNVNTQAIASV